MALRKDGERAKAALLKASMRVFAKHGYRKATNARLCRACGMNAASVNYYFGSKRKLYREAWKYAYNEARKILPMCGGVPKDASPEERLRGRITSLVVMYTDKSFDSAQMVVKEMESKLNILDDLWEEVLVQSHKMMEEILDDFFGGIAAPSELKMHCTTISTMCRLHYLSEKSRIRTGDEFCSIESMTRQIYDFAMRSLNARRDELRAGAGLAPMEINKGA